MGKHKASKIAAMLAYIKDHPYASTDELREAAGYRENKHVYAEKARLVAEGRIKRTADGGLVLVKPVVNNETRHYCNPGRMCLSCPYDDCYAYKSGEITQEEKAMREAGVQRHRLIDDEYTADRKERRKRNE